MSPLLITDDSETINDHFRKEMQKADKLIILVGFCSPDSLLELDRLVRKYSIQNITLVLGMYQIENMPKSLRLKVLWINKQWQNAGIGEIKMVCSFKYHGQLYCFFKNNQIQTVMIGSPDLSFLVNSGSAEQQEYEVTLITNDPETLKNYLIHIEEMMSREISESITVLGKQWLLSLNKKQKVKTKQ
ncbi:restriction endonuclease [Mycoplasma wenyonii str. Massachusetts]|uniref:Restriction endonuclease n=1 Tax=Mycoplasma wenyonii (strain Massachusetts) TaxID=1197325 RepID=I6ZEB7_MYCWM|nr:restriction endonuclease PLD domain-containing protein [Mycoplasma wenyonii]AFN64922.1 restriction endonuclease [Mycoplasma wenyonii str. Massachusetts]